MRRDITGQRFGRLIAKSWVSEKVGARKRVRWICACDCGAETKVDISALVDGRVKSCGCLHREVVRARSFKHGETAGHSRGTPEYKSWAHAKSRCYSASNPKYKHYGARGIYMCGRWRHSFANFLADMGRKPSPSHSIDRVNNDGPYSPDNCRWATPTQQANNQQKDRK